MTDQKKTDWGKFIIVGIVTAVISFMVGSFSDVGIHSSKIKALEERQKEKVDNDVILQYINNNELRWQLQLKKSEDLESQIDKLKEDIHEMNVKYIGYFTTRSAIDFEEFNLEDWWNYRLVYSNEIYDSVWIVAYYDVESNREYQRNKSKPF